MEELIKLMISKGKTISTMESCTGGAIANAITNIPDASKVIGFSAVTYANDYKIKMGVSRELIKEKTVYSKEVACSMAKNISDYTNSSYGVGVTGKLKKSDDNNPYGDDDVVYLAIYNRDNTKNETTSYEVMKIHLKEKTRSAMKEEIIHTFVNKMLDLLK